MEQNTRDGASVECPIYLQPDLRERQFGDFELQPSANYEEVWKHDAMDPKHTMFGVESVTELAMRVKTCVDMAERHFTDMDVVMVSHGDSLQVLQTVLAGVDCAKHRSLPHLETCTCGTTFRFKLSALCQGPKRAQVSSQALGFLNNPRMLAESCILHHAHVRFHTVLLTGV